MITLGELMHPPTPQFPVLVSREAESQIDAAHAERGRVLRQRTVGLEARALGGDAEALRLLVLAAAGLATFERTLGRCGTAEAELHRCLSVCMHLAVGHQDASIDRWRAAECAEWCADALASLYDDHALPAHASSDVARASGSPWARASTTQGGVGRIVSLSRKRVGYGSPGAKPGQSSQWNSRRTYSNVLM